MGVDLTSLADAELQARLAAPDPLGRTAIAELFRRHFPALLRFSLYELKLRREAAEDLVHDLFEHVMQDRATFAAAPDLLGLAKTILRRRAIDAYRHKREEPLPELVDPPTRARGPVTEAHDRDLVRRLRDAVDALEPADRDLVHQRVYAGMSAAEIAQSIGLQDQGSVARRLNQVTDLLRSLMGLRSRSA